MRFKKLRLSVGIALILFIFIAGNIIAFGKLVDKSYMVQSDNQDQNAILVDPKQIAPKEIQTETKPIQPVEEVQNSSPPEPIEQPKPKVVEPTPPPPEPVVVHHHRRRTRAS